MPEEIGRLVKKVTHNRRFQWLFWVLVLLAILLGVIVVPIEKAREGATINNLGEGLWWAVTTVTGVGYGDMVPVTGWGRVAGAFLEVFGVVLFGSVVAFVAVELLRYQEDYYIRRLLRRIDELETKLDGLKKHLDFLVKREG